MAEYLKGPSFSNVAQGATAVLELPKNLTYERIILRYAVDGTAANAAAISDDITGIRLKMGGVVHWELTGAELLAINEFKGHSLTDGYLNLFFSDLITAATQGKDGMALGLKDARSAQLEVDIKAGTVNPTLEADFQARKLITGNAAVRKYRRFTAQAAGGGELVYNSLPVTDAFAALYLFSSIVDKVELRRDQDTIFEATTADLTEIYTPYERSIPSGCFPVTLQIDHRLADAISMAPGGQRVNNFDLIMTTSGAGNIGIVAELIGPQGR